MNVEQATNPAIWNDLEQQIKACDADSVVGALVVALLTRVQAVLSVGKLESDIYETFRTKALQQARVWYFG